MMEQEFGATTIGSKLGGEEGLRDDRSHTKCFIFTEESSEKLKDVSDVPRQTIPLPLLSSPPCLDVSSVHPAGCQSKRDCMQERGKLISFWERLLAWISNTLRAVSVPQPLPAE